MKLRLIKWLEEQILHREADKGRLHRLTLTQVPPSQDEAHLLKMQVKQVVDYRIHVGARARVDPGGMREGRQRVFEILCHELFGELIDEIYRTEEWAYLEGYDEEVRKRIRRLADLAKGKEVENDA